MALVLSGKQHRGENASDAGAGGDVEVIGDSSVQVAGFQFEHMLQIGQSFARENALHVDVENADFASLVLDRRDAIVDSGRLGLSLKLNFGGRGSDVLGDQELLIVTTQEKALATFTLSPQKN
jgi:hypothetical protein